jgi:glycosyltransferase involved in cell wall biosynthesis
MIHIVTNGLHRRAGTERVIYNLGPVLADKFDALLWVPGRADCCFGEIAIKTRSAGVGDFPEHGFLSKLRSRASYAFSIYRAVKHGDILLGFAFDLNAMLIILATLKGARVVVCEHINYDYHHAFRRFIRSIVYRSKNTTVVVLTERDKEKFKKIGIDAVVIPNFVEQKIGYSYSLDRLARKSILSIGRIVKQKNFSFLISAFAISGLSSDGWTLRVVGNGPLLADLERQVLELGVASSVHFVEPADDISDFYQQASVFCLTSEYEAFPMVLLEAMAHSLPIVSLDCPTGPREILPEDASDQLVPPKDPAVFANRLVQIVKSQQRCEQLAHRNFSHVERFSKTRISLRWHEIFSNEKTSFHG